LGKIGSDSFIRLRAPMVTSQRDGVSEYRDWDNATQLVVPNVMVQPFKMAEKLNFEVSFNREFVRTAYRFLLEGDFDILPTDKVIWSGSTMEVFGHKQTWKRFNGYIFYTGFIARISDG